MPNSQGFIFQEEEGEVILINKKIKRTPGSISKQYGITTLRCHWRSENSILNEELTHDTELIILIKETMNPQHQQVVNDSTSTKRFNR
jgi:hypothetical protein